MFCSEKKRFNSLHLCFFLLHSTLIFSSSNIFAYADTIKFFGFKPSKSDSVFSFNAIHKFKWNVVSYNSQGKQNAYQTDDIDSITFTDKIPQGLLLSTNFYVDTALLYKTHSLYYAAKGSIRIILNGRTLANEGIFSKDKKYPEAKIKNKGFADFVLTNQKNNLQILVVAKQGSKTNKIEVRLGNTNWRHNEEGREQTEKIRGFSLTYFYLAFAIILILLYFSIRNKEYLYFGLFCLFTSIEYFTGNLKDTSLLDSINLYSTLISLEFLAIFMALAILKSNKSKIPLLLLFLLPLLRFIPGADFSLTLNLGQLLEVPIFEFITVIIFIVFSSFSFLYYWIQGFGQRQWDIKVLTYGILVAIFFVAIFPMILGFNGGYNQNDGNLDTADILSTLGVCVYPVLIAIVLAKRYGDNQKQLTQQVITIKQLGKENLQKETEKKKILEEQNVFLEHKVTERTKELAEKNSLILIKNKEITDSLVYAKRIQAAILPDIKLIYKALEQSFILYLPKDIVSGDFYGFAQKDGKVIIAAADCTGHGVAGAFMSMIGSSLLNTIINEKNITSPAKILDALNNGIIHSLNQRESESNDGMDISICTFDMKNSMVEFAGANRPLWLIRDNEILVYKPDKFPIGGLQVMETKTFSNHQIALQKNDALYLFSDGYADQFGGSNGKKLMTKKFKEELLSIQNLSMHDQENYLKNIFYQWKGNNEQVDDVLVIGIRI